MLLPTLQRYIFRELIRVFLLTAVALTVVLSTCGGVYSLTLIEDVTPKVMLMLLGLVVPMCAAFALPIASLFSATAVYGRLSDDNEFTACRSSGINIHLMLLPCVAVSLISAATTFLLFNFIIPGFMGDIRTLTRTGIVPLMISRLEQGRALDYSGLYLRAGQVLQVPRAAPGPENHQAILIGDVAFVQTNSDDIVRFGTGDSAAIRINLAGTPTVEAELSGIKIYELLGDKHVVPDLPTQRLGPKEIPMGPARLRPSFMSLPMLLDAVRRPEKVFPKVIDEVQSTRRQLLTHLVRDALEKGLGDPQGLQLADGQGGRVIVQTEGPAVVNMIDADEDDWQRPRIMVAHARVRWSKPDAAPRDYRADLVSFELSFPPEREAQMLIRLTGHVTLGGAPGKSQDIGPLPPPEEASSRYSSPALANDRLWDRKFELDLGEEFATARKKMRKERIKHIHDIIAEINVRTVYSISVLVLAVLGACLAIIYRGGHMLIAFGIGFVPALVVVVFSIMGKALAKGEGGLVLGLGIMWAALLLVATLGSVVLFRYLPR